ncbi:NAD(P)-dependent oxidoreductase [Archangium sp.]|uniref:SDR family oxidoreductase n=1 Tax=Archangium sp. TaxID=1872627 RepID=UPI00286BB116|nr:NAD(P)-dependent oxidoreductase [Archangium sp.]
MNTLKGKTLFITGASRGIGLAIAKRAARDGANVVIAAKTAEPHPRLPGTIHTAAEEIEREGGKALPLMVDIRYEEQLKDAVKQAVECFGGIDILVNNASAISLTGTLETPMKKFDLMFGVNVRGTYATTQACLPELLKAKNPHVLMLSPPLSMKPKWFQNHVAYTMAKYGMSMCVFGMAEEFREQGVAFNALWPRTTIATAAVNMLGGQEMMEASRTPEIMSDAAHAILTRDSRSCTGNFFLDEDLLREAGVTDFAKYLVKPGTQPLPDFFID